MIYCSSESTQQNREPWLAVSLSWLVPGVGQLYENRYARGSIFIVLVGLFYVFWLASLMSTKCSFLVSLGIKLCSYIILPAFACLSAFKIAKRVNTGEFETERTLSKDPWLAVFLSLLLPGLGHAYIRKGVFCVLYIFIFLALRILSMRAIYAFIALSLFRVCVGVHAYAASPIHREQKKNTIIMFAILLMSVQCMSGILIPRITTKYIVQKSNPLEGSSMNPTIKNNDTMIINKLAYLWYDPEIGDIVALTIPETEYLSCKRVVAVGGETVQVKEDKIYVNGKMRKFKIPEDSGGDAQQNDQIANNRKIHNSYLKFGVDKPYRVPEGRYFVLGDNIQHSVDSRYYGAFPKEKIVGKVIKIYWPLHRIGTLY
jgi:signal peptidase I